MAGTKKRDTAAANLPDDLIVDVLRRLPFKSLCRMKCVSRWCRELISHPDHRKKLPQTLSGFFYTSSGCQRFTGIPGNGPPLFDLASPFLPRDVDPVDSCNGLLLYHRRNASPQDELHYVVCNPATKKWVAVPGSGCGSKVRAAYLGFDPAVSSHFHVFELVPAINGYKPERSVVVIYSSKNGEWVHREIKGSCRLSYRLMGVFLNGLLHFVIFGTVQYVIMALDTDGRTQKIIPTPSVNGLGFVGQSQGRLYFVTDRCYDRKLAIWVFEDHGVDRTGEWILKHNISTLWLFGRKGWWFQQDYDVIAIHPDCRLVFFVSGRDHALMSYDMDRAEVHVICNLGQDCANPFLPYVPLFSELLADQH